MKALCLLLRVFNLRPLAPIAAALLVVGCAAPLPPRPEIPHGAGLLWQIEKEGLQPSYVFGTMHVPDPEFLALAPAIEDALERSQQVAVELKTERKEAAAQLQLYVDAALLPDGQSLQDLLDPGAYAQVLRIALRQQPRRIWVGPYHISQFKPWFVMEVVGKADSTASHLSRSRPVLDGMLERRALRAGKTVIGLETFEEQLAVSNGMPMADQVALLKAHLGNYNNWHYYAAHADTYRQGDTAMMYGLWRQSLTGVESELAHRYTERYLDGRNRVMVDRALPLMEEASTFVAVGALHLPGEQGVLRLLERQGYRVTRLN
jgi:hypothetical protein